WSATRAEGDPSASRPVAVGALGVCLAAIAAVLWLGFRNLTGGPGPIAIDSFRWATDIVVLIGTMLSIALTDDYTRRSEPIAIRSGADAGPGSMLAIGLALMLVGFAFKVAAAPFHMWTPDVYDGAPTPFTAFMAAAVKTGAFATFIRVFIEGFSGIITRWHPV